MKFVSHSQAGQDLFVHALLPKTDGSFLDVGCGAPITINNTYALEQLGWFGVLVDNSPEAVEACRAQRKCVVKHADATRIEWDAVLESIVPQTGPVIDYLSLDIDEATASALRNLLRYDLRFRVLTVEDDSYRHGDLLRAPIREMLLAHGYDIFASDVRSDDGLPYEMWACAPELSRAADRFRSSNMKWRDILSQAGVQI